MPENPSLSKKTAQIATSVAMLSLAGFMTWKFFSGDKDAWVKGFFYDESSGEIFTAKRDLIPPIQGVDGPALDAFRAVVVSTTGNPKDKKSWKVVYLERYSAELKNQMEEAQRTSSSPDMGRGMAQSHRFVKRPGEAQWHPMNSDEAAAILGELAALSSQGITPMAGVP